MDWMPTKYKRKSSDALQCERDVIWSMLHSATRGLLTHEVAKALKQPRYVIRNRLNELHADGEVRKELDGRTNRWFAVTDKDDAEDHTS